MRVDFQLNPLQKAILFTGFYVVTLITYNFDIYDSMCTKSGENFENFYSQNWEKSKWDTANQYKQEPDLLSDFLTRKTADFTLSPRSFIQCCLPEGIKMLLNKN